MKKTLVILAHPSIADSTINKAWVRGLNESGKKITVHDIYEKYPDGIIGVEHEQNLILAHDLIVFQFPMYWFNIPPLLKQWMDDVLLPGFAYGSKPEERRLGGMAIGIAVSAAIRLKDYTSQGRCRYTIKELLAPLYATALYIGADAADPFVFYGAEYNPSEAEVTASARAYLQYLEGLK